MAGLTEARVNRRRLLEGVGLGALGLAGAALLGCGSKKQQNGGATTANAPAAIGTGTGTGKSVLPLQAPVVQGTTKPGGTISQSIGPLTWVQHDAHTALAASEWHMISDKCVELNAATRAIEPSVLASWEVADPSGLTLTMKVQPGLKMHNIAPWNGREFDAADVAWNLERNVGLYADKEKLPVAAFQRASMVANLTKAEVVDPHTVKVTLSKPNSAFFAGLGDTRMMLMPKEMDEVGYNDPMKLGSMGPFQMAEYTKDVRERFKKFPQYWRPGQPTADEAAWIAIPDLAAAEAAFESGQIQLLSPLPADLPTIQAKKPDANLYTWIDSNWDHARYNMSYAPFKDFRVRQALHLALDYAALDNGYFGPGWAYQAAFSPGFPEAWSPDKVKGLPGYNPDTKDKDRADAVKLLQAAGYTNGKGIDFQIIFINGSASPSFLDHATRFSAQMQQVFSDIKVTLNPIDQPTFATRQAKSDFQMLNYTITANPDAVPEMIAQYHTVGAGGYGSRNYGQFSNPDLDSLIEKAQAELKADARTQLLDQFQQKWVDEWRPMIVYCANPARTLVQGDLAGFDKSAGTWHGYANETRIREWNYVTK